SPIPLSASLTRPPPRSPLFPYTTLFRSASLRIRRGLARWRGRVRIGECSVGSLRGQAPASPAKDDGKHDQQHQHGHRDADDQHQDRKSTRLNSSHDQISYAVFCLKKKK